MMAHQTAERSAAFARWAIALSSALGASACFDAPRAVGGLDEPVIYGADDRRDVADVDDRRWREIALGSTLARIPAARLVRQAASIEVQAPALSEARRSCPAERFGLQPSAADCSSVLVDDDLLLTAAHCADLPCASQLWALGYAVVASDRVSSLREQDLFQCRRVVAKAHQRTSSGLQYDYAFVQLDRPVSDSGHPVVLSSVSPTQEAPLTVIGYPDGLPVKIDRGAELLDARTAQRDYMDLTCDTFAGSSGSGVFDDSGQLLGTLVRGGADRRFDAVRDCYALLVIEAGRVPAEQAGYAQPALRALCDSGWASERLCMRKGRCGDDQCGTSCWPAAINLLSA
jgi:hypothetical protein